MDKSSIGLKISQMMNSDFMIEKYTKFSDGKPKTDKENYYAKLFNLSLIFFQLCPDEEKCKEFINAYLAADNSNSEYPDVQMMGLLLEMKTGLSEAEMSTALKHGVAVHFTTPKIAEQIKSSGNMSSLFNEEDRKLLYQGMSQANLNSQYVFTTGFGIQDKVCAGNITTGFYMFHTPEVLSFLYGGNFITGDREKAMEHVQKSTEDMEPELRDKLRSKLEGLWDVTCSDSNRTAVLIDRDRLEYKKNNYYGNDGEIERVEEVRPYMYGDLNDMNVAEIDIKQQEIPADALFFVNVPNLEELDRMTGITNENEEMTK